VSANTLSRERGAGRLKTLLGIAVLAALAFTAVKTIPIFLDNYELRDAMEQEARFNFSLTTGAGKSPDDIRSDIFKKVQELGLPIKLGEIQVSREANRVSISADYTVPVDLIVYQFSLHFHPQADNTSI